MSKSELRRIAAQKDEAAGEAVEPVAFFAGRRLSPEGTQEFYGYLNGDIHLENGAKLYAAPAALPDEEMLTKEMIDAPRYLILYAETPGRTIEGARENMRLSGGNIDCWPEWAKTDTGHLTKAGLAILIWHMMQAAATGARK